MFSTRPAGVALVALLASSGLAPAGEVRGQAKDLDDGPVANVTVRIFSANGALLGPPQTFAAGNYVVPLVGFPAGNKGAVVEFSAPGRKTITLTVNTETNHAVNIAMPVDDCPTVCLPHYVRSPCRPLQLLRLRR